VPHYLIDIVDPTGRYSAAQFLSDAVRLIREITARGRIPLLVGGPCSTSRHCAKDSPSSPSRTQRCALGSTPKRPSAAGRAARRTCQDRCTDCGETQAERRAADQRALEIYRVTGKPMSQLLGRTKSALPFRLLELALVPSDRAELHRRIESRFDAMLERGLVEELRALRQRHTLRPGLPSMRCVGYRQAWQHLEGEFGRNELRDRGIFATRQLAKRQLTWLRAMKTVRSFDCWRRTWTPRR